MNSILLMVVLLAPLHAIPETHRGFPSHSSQEFRNDRRQAKVILYRMAGLPYQREPSYYQDRQPYRGGMSPFPNRDFRRYPPPPPRNQDFIRWQRNRFNSIPVPYRNYVDRRVGYDYTDSYGNNIRKQKYPLNREESIADYVKRFNYEHNPHAASYNSHEDSSYNHQPVEHNPHAASYNSHEDSSYNHQPVEEEIYIEGEPEGLKQLIQNYPPLNFNPGDIHKDVTKASFQESGPESEIQGYVVHHHHHSPPAKKPAVHDEHHHVYYEKTEDSSDAASDDQAVDPELIELYKKLIEAHAKKHKHKKVHGNGGFYFKSTPKAQDKPLFFLQNENVPEEGNKNPLGENGKASFVIPRPPNTNRVVFPGPLQTYRPENPMTNFKPSPQFNKYSEPDPLYHPNGNPFETYDPPKMYPLSTPTPKELPPEISSSTINTTTVSSEQTDSEKTKFPDSINAQLPPPENGTDTRIPYVAATDVTPKTSTDSTSETKVTETMVLQTEPNTGLPQTETNTPTKSYSEKTSKEEVNKLIQSTSSEDESDSSSSSEEDQEEEKKGNQGSTTVGTTLQSLEVTKGTPEEETKNVSTDDKTSTTPNTQEMNLFFLPTTTGTEEIPQGSASRETTVIVENLTPQPAQDKEDEPTTFRGYSTVTSPTSTAEFVRIINSPTISQQQLQINKESETGKKTNDNTLQKMDHGSTAKPVSSSSQYTSALQPTTIESKPTTIYNLATGATTPYLQDNESNKKLLSQEQKDNFKTTNAESGKYSTSSIKHHITKHGKNQNSFHSKGELENKHHIKSVSSYENQNTLSDFHYIMSIINQARSHVLLSQDHSAILNI